MSIAYTYRDDERIRVALKHDGSRARELREAYEAEPSWRFWGAADATDAVANAKFEPPLQTPAGAELARREAAVERAVAECAAARAAAEGAAARGAAAEARAEERREELERARFALHTQQMELAQSAVAVRRAVQLLQREAQVLRTVCQREGRLQMRPSEQQQQQQQLRRVAYRISGEPRPELSPVLPAGHPMQPGTPRREEGLSKWADHR